MPSSKVGRASSSSKDDFGHNDIGHMLAPLSVSSSCKEQLELTSSDWNNPAAMDITGKFWLHMFCPYLTFWMLGDVRIFGGLSLLHPRNVWISTNPKSQAFSHQVSNGLNRRNLSWSHRPDWLAQDPEKTSWLGELAAKGSGTPVWE